jgi:tetratricopeptide (TPR) repeat protein
MSDVGPTEQSTPSKDVKQRAPSLFERGIFRDPLVMYMAYAAAGLVILFLATVVGALATGVIAPTGPRTAAERQLLIASEQVSQGAVGEAWAPYVDALVATGDLAQARVALAQGRASFDGTSTLSDLDLSEARLLSAEGRYADAAEMAATAMKGFKAPYDRRIAAGGDMAIQAEAAGPEAAYYDAALVQAYAYVELKRFGDAVAAFDIFIGGNPTAADVLVDRGNAKVAAKDKAGAEKDFRAALKYVPYDAEAKAGLKKIGAAQ